MELREARRIDGKRTALPRSIGGMSSLDDAAPTEAEAQALKNLARSWAGLAGQIDRYNALVRHRAVSPEGPYEQAPP